MNKVMSFISKANQVIFFFAVLIVIVILSYQLLSSLFKTPYTPPKIQIVDKDSQKKNDVEVKYKVDFERSIMDVLVFEISANAIETKQESTMLSMFEYSNKFQTVNLLFSSKSGASYKLMENNAYIRRASFYKLKDDSRDKLSKNFYLIVSNDTNGDGFLSKKDDSNLFLSDYNGKNMALVLKGVNDYQVIQDNLLLIEKVSRKNKVFYTYDVLTNTLLQIDTNIMLTSR